MRIMGGDRNGKYKFQVETETQVEVHVEVELKIEIEGFEDFKSDYKGFSD